MTEQEAISVLKMIETHGSLPTNAKDEAIKALEEIQQYRAIGTPEECRAAVEKQKEMIAIVTKMIVLTVHIIIDIVKKTGA